MLKLLVVRDRGSNFPYLLYLLWHLQKKEELIQFNLVSLENYLKIRQENYDFVIYQTFPGEHCIGKYKKRIHIIKEGDEKFFETKKIKILFDTADRGQHDGFLRLKDYTTPRIKNCPSKYFLKKYNVIFTTTYPIGLDPKLNKFSPKSIDISCRVKLGNISTKRYYIRKSVLDKLAEYKQTASIDTMFKKEANYTAYLSRVWISICPQGHGDGTFRHLQSLCAKSLMLSHESIKKYKLLPNEELIEEEDYISFNINNMNKKIEYLLKNKNLIKKISHNGYIKFLKGYSIEESSRKFYKALIKLKNESRYA